MVIFVIKINMKFVLINTKKYDVLHLGHFNPKRLYKIGNEAIPAVNGLKDLGLTVDIDLNFTKHETAVQLVPSNYEFNF